MKLNMHERLTLRNQFAILANIEIDEHLKNHYTNCSDILEHGFEGEYDQLLEGFGMPLSESDCAGIVSILVNLDQLEIPYDGLLNGEHRSYVRWLFTQGLFGDLLTDDNTNNYSIRTLDSYRDLIRAALIRVDKGSYNEV